MTVGTDRTVDNAADTNRKWPTTALAERVLTAKEGVVLELLGGTNATPIALSQPICPGTPVYVLAFITASGLAAVAPDGMLLNLTSGFTNDQSLNTLLVAYSPDQAEGTIGGQSSAS
jgi:hypothetical protein